MYIAMLIEYRHSRRWSNVFGDARFWFCPNLIKFAQILSLLPKFRFNCAQISPQFRSNLNNIYQKILQGVGSASHLLRHWVLVVF